MYRGKIVFAQPVHAGFTEKLSPLAGGFPPIA